MTPTGKSTRPSLNSEPEDGASPAHAISAEPAPESPRNAQLCCPNVSRCVLRDRDALSHNRAVGAEGERVRFNQGGTASQQARP